jgi:hypothetical protein
MLAVQRWMAACGIHDRNPGEASVIDPKRDIDEPCS